MYHVCPNYHSFYEGHCRVIWLPFLNKTLGRLYLKLLGRHKPVFETLNLVKPRSIKKALCKHGENISLISLGGAEFINKFNDEQIEKINQKMLRKVSKLLLKIPFLKTCILKLIAAANLHYPVTLIVSKNQNQVQ